MTYYKNPNTPVKQTKILDEELQKEVEELTTGDLTPQKIIKTKQFLHNSLVKIIAKTRGRSPNVAVSAINSMTKMWQLDDLGSDQAAMPEFVVMSQDDLEKDTESLLKKLTEVKEERERLGSDKPGSTDELEPS